jgi:hypothetical protein
MHAPHARTSRAAAAQLRELESRHADAMHTLIDGSREHTLSPPEQELVTRLRCELREYRRFMRHLENGIWLNRNIEAAIGTAHAHACRLQRDTERAFAESWDQPLALLRSRLDECAKLHALANDMVRARKFEDVWCVGHRPSDDHDAAAPDESDATSAADDTDDPYGRRGRERYRPQFVYAYPALAVGVRPRRIVVRNPLLVTENACATFAEFADPTAFGATQCAVMGPAKLLWLGAPAALGRRVRGACAGCEDHHALRLSLEGRAPPRRVTDDGGAEDTAEDGSAEDGSAEDGGGGAEDGSAEDGSAEDGGGPALAFNYVWLPECHVGLACPPTTLRPGCEARVRWDTTPMRDPRQRAYVSNFLTASGRARQVHLYWRPLVAYDLLVPMHVSLRYATEGAREADRRRRDHRIAAMVTAISADGELALDRPLEGPVAEAGGRLTLRYEKSYVDSSSEAWRQACETLGGFFERLVERMKVHRMRIEEQHRALRAGANTIAEWVAAQRDLIQGCTAVGRAEALRSLRAIEKEMACLKTALAGVAPPPAHPPPPRGPRQR